MPQPSNTSLLVFPFLYQHDLSSRPCGIYCQSIIRRCTLSTASCNPLIHHAVLRSPQLHLRIQFRKEADKNPGALTIDRADRPDHLGIFLLFHDPKQGGTASIAVAVGGLVLGEMVSALYTLHTFFRPFSRPEKKNATRSHLSLSGLFCGLKELLPLSLPLTANRVLLNLLQSIEAISIPGKLRQYHLSTSEALSLYGVLNGMALPCILFPSAITNSLSVMLMPTIAEIQTSKTKKELADLIKKSLPLVLFSVSRAACFSCLRVLSSA